MTSIPTAKSERLNLRCSADSLATLREAASVQGQDLTSFIMSAALDRARTVLAEDRVLRLTPHEVLQLEKVLDADPTVIPQLAGLLRTVETKRAEKAGSERR